MRFRDLTMAVLGGAVMTQLHEMAYEIRRAPSAAYNYSGCEAFFLSDTAAAARMRRHA